MELSSAKVRDLPPEHQPLLVAVALTVALTLTVAVTLTVALTVALTLTLTLTLALAVAPERADNPIQRGRRR